VLLVTPRTLDWDTVPVLSYDEKQVSIRNESEIEANFSAFMVSTVVFFCLLDTSTDSAANFRLQCLHTVVGR